MITIKHSFARLQLKAFGKCVCWRWSNYEL